MSLNLSILVFVVLDYTIAFANDTHIIGLPSIVSFAYEHFFDLSLLFDRILEANRARILSCFGLRLNTWFIIWPIFPTFRLFSPMFSTMLQTCFKLSHLSITCLPWCVCTNPIEPMGIHLLGYAHGIERMGTHDVVHNTFVAIVWDVGFHVGWEHYMRFSQPHSIVFIDELTLCSPKMEFTN